ncbi:unnamed protein product [Nippostrongylus brasiliensis]|uniref:Protein TIS11 (inferred by orthology to a D. melanogaster protein) n=1 Tax=Nippostrongylus brasiliensis TaxID=27835 RepID=A0A0N4YPT8_NIPBR|nr:unnamed protein product [Nippostrongylus brasiliensis]
MNPLTGVVPLSNAPPPKNPKLYKTELCRSWMDHGRCNYGERCQYAHGEQEKRPIPRHPKYKTEACQSYHQSGYCPYGPRCHFIHSETDLLANLSNPPTSSAPSIRSNHNAFSPLACSQQLSSSSSFGAPLGQTLGASQPNALCLDDSSLFVGGTRLVFECGCSFQGHMAIDAVAIYTTV